MEKIKQYNQMHASEPKDSILESKEHTLRQGEEGFVDASKVDKLYEWCHKLPKIDLHSHIGGCIRAKTFLSLVTERGIAIDHIDFYNINLKTAFEIFKISSELINTCSVLRRVTREIIEDYSK